MNKQATKYWSYPKDRCLLTGFYHDPDEDKKSRSTVYVPNIVFFQRNNNKRNIQ